MAAAATAPSHSTTGSLCMWNGTKNGKDAFIDYLNVSSNLEPFIEVPIVAEDMRAMNPPPSFKLNGFELRTVPTRLTAEQLENGKASPEARELIESAYYDECKETLEKVTGGEVIPFTFHVRTKGMRTVNFGSMKNNLGGLNITHVDRDLSNAELRLAFHVGEEKAQALIKKSKRWAIVNLWRPIGEPVQKWPLCIVDHAKVPDWDYETHMGRVYAINDQLLDQRGAKGHDTVLKHHPDYTYHYASGLKPEEALIFSSFDSDVAKVHPHTAFWDESSSDDAPTRRSIDVHCWVFWDEP